MNEANPLELVNELRTVLGRYIATALPISRRYPQLNAHFREQLSAQRLVDGPYVEAMPDYEKAGSLADLLKANGGFVHDALGCLPTATRPLHRHQQRALELSIQQQRSLLVATGTGSGKTETFLYPIAHELLSDAQPDRPGVRALLVYPMNALANDQLYYRIAPLFGRYLAESGITFGRYTGQVKANVSRSEEEARLLANDKLMHALGYPDRMPANWLLTREEMLRSPPKVLITNYAMLEHLLLLPRNEPLFASNALRFIVLDEIHSYRGAQATEVAFLLRKLKNRLGIATPIQVFGTSASLTDGQDADERLKQFGSNLFGEEVSEVVRGKRIVHDRLRASTTTGFSLTVNTWAKLATVLERWVTLVERDQTCDAWNSLLDESELEIAELRAPVGGDLGSFIEERLASNREVRLVAEVLDKGGVRNFRELAELVFGPGGRDGGPDIRYEALSSVIRVGTLARRDQDSFPLLPARYHIAVNGIEGVVILPSGEGEGWSEFRFARNHKDTRGTFLSLLTCRKCGQPFLEGFEAGDGKLHNRRPDTGDGKPVQRRVYWLGKPTGHVEDEVDDESQESKFAAAQTLWDPRTGSLGASEGAIPLFSVQTEEDEQEKAWYVKKCPACGGRSSGAEAEVVSRMHPGNEALGSVVAQRVLEFLPGAITDHADPRPAQGRGLLSFSDNRQDAAFFAPYFERTAGDIALRSAIRNVLRGRDTPVSARQLAEQVFHHWQMDGRQPLLLDANGDIRTEKTEVTNQLIGAIGAEFCTPGGRRNSLEALGVVSVKLEESKLRLLRPKVRESWPAGLPDDDASIDALIHILLETIRRERALARFYDVPLNDSFVWGIYHQHRTFDIATGDSKVLYKWLPAKPTQHNRRTWYLQAQLGLSQAAAQSFLQRFWEMVSKPPLSILRPHNPGFALDGELLRFWDGDRFPLFVCKSCGLLQRQVVFGRCTAFRCTGEADEISNEDRDQLRLTNHYLASYEESNHVTVRAREHTASLSTEMRESIEKEFAEHKVNLLSCTTTMEMGVDLGDLEAVINLNVPPGIANYQQRTGRAGRRAQAAPFCVTVARNSQYDQAVFRDFPRYLASSPGTPLVHLDNAELFWRHQQSIILSHFLKAKIRDRSVNAPTLMDLFGETFDRRALRDFMDAVHAFLEGPVGLRAVEEAERLVLRLPSGHSGVGVEGVELRRRFRGVMREFGEEVCERFSKYAEKMEEFAALKEFGRAGHWQRLRDGFMGQFLVDQLSRRGLIPTYSFPVHSLSLEVIRAGGPMWGQKPEVALTRDASLGITEYVPGSDVVANGRIWQSAGLAAYPKAFMPERWYVACPECFHVDIGDTLAELPAACSNCGSVADRRRRMFVEPKGFVTSFSDRNGADPGTSRRRAMPADEARLIAAPRDDAFVESGLPFLRTALLTARRTDDLAGRLFIANRGPYGEGYHRCPKCNYASPVQPKGKSTKGKTAGTTFKTLPHDDPLTGKHCANEQLSRFGLDFVHRYETDVRLFRFLHPLPEPIDPDENRRRFHERLARTVAEAFRLAAIDMLQVPPGEVRAIYRLYGTSGSTLEVVLFDGVAGGAGYSARIGQPGFAHEDLLARAKARLNCHAECDTGCRVCLCDYGNQRYWDSFDRKPALQWLASLLDGTTNATVGPYVRWSQPSLGALQERVAPYRQICMVARDLVDQTTAYEASLNVLVEWLQGGKELHIFLANPLDEHPKAQAPLSVHRVLHPYALSGRLRLYHLPSSTEADWSAQPRLFTGTEPGGLAFRQEFAVQPLTEALIASPAGVATIDLGLQEELTQLQRVAVPYPPDVLREGERMAMWELAAGAPRELETIFAPLRGSHIKLIAIRDPYCGARQHRPKLREFLAKLLAFAATVESVSVHCKEVRDRDGDVEFYLDIAREVETILGDLGVAKMDVIVSELRGSGRRFHDREMDVVVVAADGIETRYRYFLTGGIDYLVDQKAETKVFQIRLN